MFPRYMSIITIARMYILREKHLQCYESQAKASDSQQIL